MARKTNHSWRPVGAAGSAKALVQLVEEAIRRNVSEKAELLHRLEAAARCGALFAGSEGVSWGEA
jgi:hypothetical protein